MHFLLTIYLYSGTESGRRGNIAPQAHLRPSIHCADSAGTVFEPALSLSLFVVQRLEGPVSSIELGFFFLAAVLNSRANSLLPANSQPKDCRQLRSRNQLKAGPKISRFSSSDNIDLPNTFLPFSKYPQYVFAVSPHSSYIR